MCKEHQGAIIPLEGNKKWAHGRPNNCCQVKTLELTQILSCALNKPINSFFDYFPIIECMCEVGRKSHLMQLLKHGTNCTFVTILSIGRSQSTVAGVYCQKLSRFHFHQSSYLLESTLILTHSHADIH